MKRTAPLLLAGSLLASIGLSACSSSSTSSTTTAPASTTAPAKQVASKPIPEADRSPAGAWGHEPQVVVPTSTPSGDLEYAALIPGSGPAAKAGDTVEVHYVLASVSSGKVVQSSWSSQPFSFTLGQGQVISGWDGGLIGAQAGGRYELIFPPTLGYGAQSPGEGISANDTLVFVVDVLKIS